MYTLFLIFVDVIQNGWTVYISRCIRSLMLFLCILSFPVCLLPYLSVLYNGDFSFSVFVLVFVPREVDVDLYVHCFFLFIVYCFPFLVWWPAPFSYQFKVCTWPLVSDCFQLYVHVVLSMYLYPLLLNLWYWFVFGVSMSLCSGRLLNVYAQSFWLFWIFFFFFICDFLLNTKNTVLIAMRSDRLFCEILLIMHINVKCFFYIY